MLQLNPRPHAQRIAQSRRGLGTPVSEFKIIRYSVLSGRMVFMFTIVQVPPTTIATGFLG